MDEQVTNLYTPSQAATPDPLMNQHNNTGPTMTGDKPKQKMSIVVVSSILLLFAFFLLTIGVIVTRNRQEEQLADTRTEAAALGDLMSGNNLTPQACADILLYKNNQRVTPTTLQPGESIEIAIVAGTATKARVSINQGAFVEMTTKNSRNEYVLAYSIPADMRNVLIKAERFINNAWQ